MKQTYFNIIKASSLLLLLGLSFSSCKKFLERPPEGQLSEEIALKDAAGVAALLNSVYKDMGEGDKFYGGKVTVINELLGDQLDGILLTEDFGEIYKRKTSIFGGFKNDFYTQAYNMIARANVALSKLDVAGSERNNLEGQAKFIRGVVHFELVRLFAQPFGATSDNSHPGIPLRLVSDLSSGTRASVKQVYDQVIADLKEAETKLPATNGVLPTKGAAQAFLAKVYFQMNSFANAYQYANLTLTGPSAANYGFVSAVTELDNRFSFNGSNEGIFKIRIEATSPTAVQFGPGGGLRDNFRSDTKRPTLFFTTDIFNQVNNSGDRRSRWLKDTLTPTINVLKKYNKDNFILPVVHVTEIKMIRAESAAETGTNLAVAINDLNDILTRAYGNATRNLPANGTAADIILAARQQRTIEMVGEGNRTQEIKRIGARSGTNVDRRGSNWNCPGFVLQFPQGEMAANTEFVRNPEGGCN